MTPQLVIVLIQLALKMPALAREIKDLLQASGLTAEDIAQTEAILFSAIRLRPTPLLNSENWPR